MPSPPPGRWSACWGASVRDEVRRLSEVLARDPSSLAYAELGELLRRRGQMEEALQVALQGLTRNPMHADGHDALARIYADMGDLERARLAWSKALEIAPDHPGALKGIAFLLFRQGDARGAAAALDEVLAANPADEPARRAHEKMQEAEQRVSAAARLPVAPAPAAPPAAAELPGRSAGVFQGFDGATNDILLLDQRGLIVAGGVTGAGGADVSELAAAALAGVSLEASRAGEYIGLGAWRTIMAEADAANLVVAPVGERALVLVRRDRSTPIGLALRLAVLAGEVASAWLRGRGA
jgi:tetratricopeptide (TPR) repeat protein